MSCKRPLGWLSLVVVAAVAPAAPGAAPEPSAWSRVPEILATIVAPTFPDHDFDIRDYGARGDGQSDATDALRKAIAVAHERGGGRVVVPPGVFLTGAIHLKSNVNLHVSEGATLRFSQDPAAYLPVVLTRFEGVECWNYSPLIYAHGQVNIAVTGKGVLDGQADAEHWWPWKGGWASATSQRADRDALFAQAEKGVPVDERVYGAGHFLRPSFFEPYRCKNVLVEGVTFKNSPMWFLHPVLCQNVTIRGVTTVANGPNTDGCNPESSKDVLIEDSYFDNGDDCIALKSGRNADGRRLATPVENVIIRRCRMKNGHGGVTIGSEISGGARNIFAEDCTMSSPDLDRGLRIKTNSIRGGVIEDVHLRNITVGEVREAPISIDLYYEEGDAGPHTPTLRSIHVSNMRSAKSRYALYLAGYERAPIRDVRLADCAFDGVEQGTVVRGAVDVVLTNVTINGKPVSAAGETAASGSPWSLRMTSSAIARDPDPLTIDTGGPPRWNYTQGLQLMAMLKVWERTGEARYFDYVKRFYDGMIDADGKIRGYSLEEFNIDRINSGKCLFTLYRETKDEKYRKAIELLRDQMRRHPRTSEGGFWHKQIYPHQMWLDGLYMGSPFLAEYAVTFNEPATLDDVARQFILMETHARDEKTGLLYHAWDESRQQRWCDPATGRSRHFWGRAMGWYAMALVDALDFFPKDHPRRPELIAILGRLADAIAKVQHPFDGVWYQILDQPDRERNYQEASVTTMFAYALLKGTRLGYLDPRHRAAGRKAYEGALSRFIEVDAQGQVHIHKVCAVAGLGGRPYRDGSYEYYVGERVASNDPKGLGPFILASLENEAQK